VAAADVTAASVAKAAAVPRPEFFAPSTHDSLRSAAPAGRLAGAVPFRACFSAPRDRRSRDLDRIHDMASFDALHLRPELVKACRRQGFTAPLPIQSLVVPLVKQGKDAVVEAMTGSGKTLAYALPLLDREPLQTARIEVLVVVPTRELAEQIADAFVTARGTLDRPVALLTGRGGMDKQRAELEAGATIAVGTLGRIEELLERKFLSVGHVRTLVLDEVDELINGGFGGNLAAVIKALPKARQTLLFSATVPTEVEKIARQFMRDAARLRLSVARETPAQLVHRVIHTAVEDRVANLVGYLEAAKPYQAVVFCGTRHETEEVKQALDELGLVADFLHGELSPLKRRQLVERFRSGDLPVLVASDLAARGLDLPGVDLVVNYSLPAGTAQYLHRAGRTGRAGKPGTVMSLVIGQQFDVFEKLKPSFTFESAEISTRGKLFTHPTRTQEERDRLFSKKPPKQYWKAPEDAPPAPAPDRREARDERPARRTDAKRDPRPQAKGKPPRRDERGPGRRKR